LAVALTQRDRNLVSVAPLQLSKKPREIHYANFYTRSHDALIMVYDKSGNVIETHEHRGDFKER
jgi:hypothetical protein